MGTRNLTMVISNSKTKVAQYGQWDGYPSGQGSDILAFLKETDLEKFKKKINKVKWLTKKQCLEIEKDKDWDIKHPYLSRDCAGQILKAIMNGEIEVNDYPNGKKTVKVNVIGLVDKSSFAGDSLFCEWAYVVDLDKNTFEVYQGFNKTPLTENDRFFYLQEEKEEYKPVKMVKSYLLNNLPKEDVFIEECDPKEEEEEA